MSDDIRSDACCPTGEPGSTLDIFGYEVDGDPAHPPPTVTCPKNFNAWLHGGQYVVPDFSNSVEIDAPCTAREDFTITQNPPAGTIITIGGEIVITITVTDRWGNTVTCSFTINIHDPSTPPGTTPDPPTILPPWIYAPGLFAYWAANDTQCTVGATDGDPPCWFRRDLSQFLGNTSPRHLSNGGDAILVPQESGVSGFAPGPTYHRGSMYADNQLNGYLYRADDTDLRLLATAFTIRMFFKLMSMVDTATWALVGKYDAVGYRIKLVRSGSEYRLSPELRNNSTALVTTYRLIALNAWIHVAMTFDPVLGRLRFYVNGVRVEETTSAGFLLSGEASQFRVGQPASGSGGDASALACWSLDATDWADSIGTKDMTASGSPIVASGKINGAMKDQGSSGFLTRTDAALALATGDWSVRAWANCDVFTGSGEWIVAGCYGTYGWKLFISQSGVTTSIGYEVRNSVGNTATASAVIALDTWYHLFITYTAATRTVRWYLNGVLTSTVVLANAFDGSSTTTFQIGGPLGSLAALADEVAIWTAAKDQAYITADYNSGNGTGCPFDTTSTAQVYHDEIGIWRQAWTDARVAEDYTICSSIV